MCFQSHPIVACLFSFYTIPICSFLESTGFFICLSRYLLCYAQCCHGDGSGVRHVHIKYHGHSLYYQATMLAIVIYCLRLFNIYCSYGNGSDGRRHVCSKYHGHTYRPLLRLFVVLHKYKVTRTIRLLCW